MQRGQRNAGIENGRSQSLIGLFLHGGAGFRGVSVERDILYGQAGGRRLELDLYRPALPASPAEPLPCVLFIHGGAWRYGSRRTNSYMCRYLAARGLLCASIDYRLSREARWPAQLEDCEAALGWLHRNAAEFGGDGSRIGAMGTSAGAHLAAVLALATAPQSKDKHARPLPRVQAVCDWYGPSDLTAEHPVSRRAEFAVRSLIGSHPSESPALAAAASPVRHVSAAAPPFLIVHGTLDPVVPFEQSTRLHEALVAAGVDSTLLAVPGGRHGRFINTRPGVIELLAESWQFLERQLESAKAERTSPGRVS